MPKVKIFKVYKSYSDDGYGGYDTEYDISGYSDWEEVSEDELVLLQKYLNDYRYSLRYKDKYRFMLRVLSDDAPPAIDFIKNIKEMLKKQQVIEKERAAKAKETEKERKKKAEARKIEKAKKILKEKGLL